MTDLDNLHAYLKASTRPRHDSTEETMGGIGLGTRPEYISFLRVQAAAVMPLEAALAAYDDQFRASKVDWTHRSGLLAHDLQALNETIPQGEPQTLASFDHALGVAYTLEGSRLGNAMMYRQFQVDHPNLAATAATFLGYPAEHGFWRKFMDSLMEEAVERGRWLNIRAGSMLAFDVFQHSAEIELQRLARQTA